MKLLHYLPVAVGLLIAVWLLAVTVGDYLWARQPLVKAFYAYDQLRDRGRRDSDGLFHAPAFDHLVGLSLSKARQRVQSAGFNCEPLTPDRRRTSCYYGYQTDTGCCRFRVVFDYSPQATVTQTRGDKTGRCER